MTTRTLPAREPDGWWIGHSRYRSYVLFAATGFVLSLVNVVLLLGLFALGRGLSAWTSFLSVLGSPIVLLGVAALLLGTLFFSIRWLRVGVKIPQVALGPMPAPGAGLLYVAHFAGLAAISALLLALLSGVIL